METSLIFNCDVNSPPSSALCLSVSLTDYSESSIFPAVKTLLTHSTLPSQ